MKRAACLALGALLLGGCGGALDPQGSGARVIAGGWWLMFGLGTAVFVFVLVVLGLALRDGRRREQAATDGDEESPGEGEGERRSTRLIVGAGIVLPSVVIALLVGVTVWMGSEFAEGTPDPVRIDVVGHQYWWDVRYPDLGVRTANEIHVPAGRDVELRFTSADVIHSFWVPQLHGKIDLLPGRTTTLTIDADEPGEYRGQCAEFCAIGHAYMRVLVIAQQPDDFDAWVAGQAEPGRQPATTAEREGLDVFLGSACVYCHRVEGTNATSEFGPDLTHLASRRTLGAGVLDNNRGSLAGWILDPQHHKPGNRMPATALDAEELQRILDYLEQLE